MKLVTAVMCAVALACAPFVAPALGSYAASRVAAMPFFVPCRGTPPKPVLSVPHGVHAQFALPPGWRTVPVAARDASSSGGDCGQQGHTYVNVAGDSWDCLQQTVYATALPQSGPTSPAAFLGQGYVALARGRLPTVAGMHGIWEELNEGVTPAYPTYSVDAVYFAARGRTFYELSIFPSPNFTGACRGKGSTARGVARQLVQSFRIAAPSGG